MKGSGCGPVVQLSRTGKTVEPRAYARIFSMTSRQFDVPPVIIGAGPAGLAAAGTFVEAGIRPIILRRPVFPAGRVHDGFIQALKVPVIRFLVERLMKEH